MIPRRISKINKFRKGDDEREEMEKNAKREKNNNQEGRAVEVNDKTRETIKKGSVITNLNKKGLIITSIKT